MRLLIILCCVISLQLSAHEMKSAVTKVLFNQRTGTIEIMHRFYLHDAEHAVKKLLDKSADLLAKQSTRDSFALYVSSHFQLRTSGQDLKLTLVGSELDGRFFWVYQEVTIPQQLTQLELRHDSLQSLWPDQVNVVNIEGRGKVKTLKFTPEQQWQQVQLSK
ncbi:hypothetical protein EMM73_14510 [Rheinheimera sediminis]|uniref:DUF6702 family protein n=1 Tax=Rheinheimera sp. YQF-1 TaxID=2499626 RepID=UPI000FDC3EBB|nr:DUF6702 family protein [Rheinheimera sp. YQF-1]RVT45262.1 hypothetical protein EMM73_14510 [Rheinheimera sp. YQF-1]